MTPNILQVITDCDRRGAQLFAIDLEGALVEQGRSVRTIALAPGNVGGLDVQVLGSSRLGVSTLRALRREFQRADVVLAHGSSTLPACAVAGVGTGTPFVYRQISDSKFWAPSGLRRARVRAGMARAAHVVALWQGSAVVLSEHLGISPEKITVIPNAVDDRRFVPGTPAERARARTSLDLHADAFMALYVGALVPEKGVDLAVDAVRELPDAHLVVVGDGPERERIAASVTGSAAERIHLLGSSDDVLAAYQAADVVVLPSRGGDSMPATLIEGGLCGLPAISTPVDGIPEIVVDGETGILTPVGESAALREALDRLHRDPELRRTTGGAARARCRRRFSLEVVAAQWADLVDQVTAAS